MVGGWGVSYIEYTLSSLLSYFFILDFCLVMDYAFPGLEKYVKWKLLHGKIVMFPSLLLLLYFLKLTLNMGLIHLYYVTMFCVRSSQDTSQKTFILFGQID